MDTKRWHDHTVQGVFQHVADGEGSETGGLGDPARQPHSLAEPAAGPRQTVAARASTRNLDS